MNCALNSNCKLRMEFFLPLEMYKLWTPNIWWINSRKLSSKPVEWVNEWIDCRSRNLEVEHSSDKWNMISILIE